MFSKLLNIGIYNSLDFYQKREVKILNTLALIVVAGLLIGSTNVFFLGELYPAIAELIIALSSIVVYFLNWKRKYNLAAYVFVVSINCTIFFIAQYYDRSTDTYLYYFPVTFCIALLHNPNKSGIRTFLFFFVVLLSFLSSRFLDIPLLNGTHFTAEQNHLLFLYNVYFCVILTIALVYLFVRILDKQYSDLSQLVDKTKADKVIIANSLKEKEVLLAELQHRVKNNLAVIIALFNFQKENTLNSETKTALNEAKNRVLSIAMVHEQLHTKENLSQINLDRYLSELINEILRSHPLFSNTIIKKQLAHVQLDITKTIPVGLIINEILTNSLKHGYTSQNKIPEIELSLIASANYISIKMKDNGIGFPEPLEKNTSSLGISLIESLTEQIDGKVTFSNNNGAQVEFTFPQ